MPIPSPMNLDPTELLEKLDRLLASLEAKPVPLSQLRDEVMVLYAKPLRESSTRSRMKRMFEELMGLRGGPKTTTDLTPEIVTKFVTKLTTWAKPETTNGYTASLKTACNFAKRKGYIKISPFEGRTFRVVDQDPKSKVYHSRQDLARLLAYLEERTGSFEGGRLLALTAVVAYTGLRRTEALRLKTADVDFNQGVIFIRRNGRRLKTVKSEAAVPMPDALAAILREWLPRAGEWVFPNRTRPTPWTGGKDGCKALDAMQAAAEAVGIEGLTFLSLRHSLATHFGTHWGLGQTQIKLCLRHSHLRTQERYVHPDLVNLVDVVRGFDFLAPARVVQEGRKRRKRGRRMRLKSRPQSRMFSATSSRNSQVTPSAMLT